MRLFLNARDGSEVVPPAEPWVFLRVREAGSHSESEAALVLTVREVRQALTAFEPRYGVREATPDEERAGLE